MNMRQVLLGICVLAALGSVSATRAGEPQGDGPGSSPWSRFSIGDLSLGEAIGLARTPGDDLVVGWARTANGADDLMLTRFGSGSVGRTARVTTGWTNIGGVSVVVVRDNVRLFFNGQHSTAPGELLVGLITAAKRTLGSPWHTALVATEGQAYGRTPVAIRNPSMGISPKLGQPTPSSTYIAASTVGRGPGRSQLPAVRRGSTQSPAFSRLSRTRTGWPCLPTVRRPQGTEVFTCSASATRRRN